MSRCVVLSLAPDEDVDPVLGTRGHRIGAGPDVAPRGWSLSCPRRPPTVGARRDGGQARGGGGRRTQRQRHSDLRRGRRRRGYTGTTIVAGRPGRGTGADGSASDAGVLAAAGPAADDVVPALALPEGTVGGAAAATAPRRPPRDQEPNRHPAASTLGIVAHADPL